MTGDLPNIGVPCCHRLPRCYIVGFGYVSLRLVLIELSYTWGSCILIPVLTVCLQDKMPPRRDPDAILRADMSQMAQAVTGLTRLMTQQTTNNAAQATANANREAAENELHAQRDRKEEAAAQARVLSDFRCHDPPKFYGNTDPEKADLWIQEVEKIFTVLHTPDAAMLDYVAYLLLGDAEYWWR